MIPAACALLAIGILAYIFILPDEVASGPVKSHLSYLRERKEAVYENLRDLNFENKAGKFSAADYVSLQDSLQAEAAAVLAEIAQLEKT